MTPARMLLATAFVASAPVWIACSSDDPTTPAPVLITGSWTGTMTVGMPTVMCPLDQTIVEDTNGNVTGTAVLQAPCVATMFTVTGTNNTGGVADSVELTFGPPVAGPGLILVFNGNFDGADGMSGLSNGGGCINCPTSFTRN